jgi:hypothetical protein
MLSGDTIVVEPPDDPTVKPPDVRKTAGVTDHASRRGDGRDARGGGTLTHPARIDPEGHRARRTVGAVCSESRSGCRQRGRVRVPSQRPYELRSGHRVKRRRVSSPEILRKPTATPRHEGEEGDMQRSGDGGGGPHTHLETGQGAVVLDLNVDGIVLTVDPSRSGLQREGAKRLLLKLANKILPHTGGNDRIDRIGMLDNYRLPHEASAEAAVSALTNLSALGKATDVAMRLSFRSATEQALVSREIRDWRNTIIQVWNRKSEEEGDQVQLSVSIDYQTYLEPERQYHENLVEDHYRHFLERLEALQSGRLAGLSRDEAERR